MLLFKINKETKEFIGFYDSDIHDVTSDGLEFFELSKESHEYLLEGQSTGKEIRIIDKEKITIGLYEKVPYPNDMIKPEYDYENHVWIETANEKEQILNLKKQANEELESTSKFDLLTYRNRMLEEEIEEMDLYRSELLDIVEICNQTISGVPQTLSKLSSAMPEKPDFIKKYI